MKVAVIVNSLRFGGAEVQTVELVNRLSEKGVQVLLMSMDNVTAVKERISDTVRTVILAKRAYMDLGVLSRIVKLIKEFKPEYLLTVNSYSAMYGYLASFFTGRSFKMVSIQHTTLFSGFVDAVQNLYYNKMIKRMDKVIFVSSNQREHWIRKYGIKAERSTVIYNGIDLDRFQGFRADTAKIRESFGIAEGDIVIGINASFRAEKKHEDLVDALEILLEQGYPVKVMFIGDGDRRSFIQKYAAGKGLGERVVITGFVQDVRPYLSCLDVSVLTSVAVETLSIAVIESMALGKPVVLSDIGGASELVDPGENGFLYDAGDVGQLADALKKIIDGKLFASMGKKSLEKAKKLFDGDKMAEGYLKALKK